MLAGLFCVLGVVLPLTCTWPGIPFRSLAAVCPTRLGMGLYPGNVPEPFAVLDGVVVVALGRAELIAAPGERTAVVFAAGIWGVGRRAADEIAAVGEVGQ